MWLHNKRRTYRFFFQIQPLAMAVMASLAFPVYAQPFTRVVSFGDSLSDTGNIFEVTSNPINASLLGILFPELDPPIPPPPYFEGRFSNGPVWVERLAERLGADPLLPSEEGGFNYAVGGATTFDDGNFLINLIVPDDVEDQVDAYLSDHTPAAAELFIVEGGANDLLSGGITEGSVPAGNIEDFIVVLHNAGARNFLVPNLPPLGKIPGEVGGTDEAVLDARALDFNASLSARLDSLENSLADVVIYRADFHGAVQAALNDPAAFGFTNVDGAAFDENSNQVVPNPEEYLFWDNIHPTAPAHRLLGDWAASAILPSCSFNVDVLCDVVDINLMFAEGDLVVGVAVPPADEKFDLAPFGDPDSLIDNADVDIWLMQSAAADGFLAPYRRGDADFDRDVDITDFNQLAANFDGEGNAIHAENWQLGNFDGDGDIDITDFNFIAANFADDGYGLWQTVPEPAAVVLWLSAVLSMLPWCSCRT